MREIKFRGWDHENKCWRYGWLTRLVEGVRRFMAIISETEDDLVRYYIHETGSIGQYTGLQDKNGVEIYEGDILAESFINCNRIPEILTYRVVWGKHSFSKMRGWGLVDSGGVVYEYFYGSFDEKDLEVVGNIWESPEMLQ